MQIIKKIRDWSYQHAILAAFIAFVVIDVIWFSLEALLSLLPATLPVRYLCEIITILVPVAIVFFFGFSSTFKKGKFFKGLLYALPFILFQVILMTVLLSENFSNPETRWKSTEIIIFEVFCIIGVGIREECIYRATIQNIVAKKHANSVKGIWITVIVSSIIFGLCHVTNIFFGVKPLAVLSQVISATCLGSLLSAVYLRSGSIWALIFIHTLTDLAGYSGTRFLANGSNVGTINTLSFSVSSLIFNLLFIGLAIFLLRPSKCNQVYENLCFADEKSDLSIDA